MSVEYNLTATQNLKYISDVVGEEYRNWQEGDIIFIQAPTGSGKTHFVLNILLKWAIQNNKPILYLVNRKVLREQIVQEIKRKEYSDFSVLNGTMINYSDFIRVITYQSMEQELLGRKNRGVLSGLEHFAFVVYDECHYFFSDSNFNTNTELSYDCLSHEFDKKIQIFMSATMKNIKCQIEIRRPVLSSCNCMSHNLSIQWKQKSSFQKRVKEYRVEADYNYLNIRSFDKMEEIEVIIRNSLNQKSEKWLVFTDSIERGKKLKEDLTDLKKDLNIDEKEVVFIDADYENDEDGFTSIKELTNNYLISKKVVIATSVMDNGVSFHDNELRNIVIMADEEESFVQMLGRKRVRKDGAIQNVKLYICKRDVDHFNRRLQNIERKIEVYDKYRNTLERMLFDQNEKRVNPAYVCWVKWKYLPVHIQQNVLYEMIHEKSVYQSLKSFCYVVQGGLCINSFSVFRLKCIKTFYEDMIDKLKEDENAFLKQQLAWLGRGVEEIQTIEKESFETIGQVYREELQVGIEELFVQIKPEEDGSIVISKEENRCWKNKYARQLQFLLERDVDGCEPKDLDCIRKNDRAIPDQRFNRCMQMSGLPYQMETLKNRGYRIKKVAYE